MTKPTTYRDATGRFAPSLPAPHTGPAEPQRPTKIVSFGYRYGPAGQDPHDRTHLEIDLRPIFIQNPHRLPRLRPLTGLDTQVAADILKAPRFAASYTWLKHRIAAAVAVDGVTTVWLGCHGGRHRSVYVADRLGREWGVAVEHRDLGKPHGGE